MSLANDPTSRRLRGAIGVAVREGRTTDEAALRRELALQNCERTLERELAEAPLDAVELRRLRAALEAYGPQRTPVTASSAVVAADGSAA